MKERPILFSAPMVRALLDGSKNQTRRIMKPQHLKFFDQSAGDMLGSWNKRPLPYGQPGDRLWVRESWRIGAWREDTGQVAIDYLASAPQKTPWITVPEEPENYHGESVFEKYWAQSTDDCFKSNFEMDDNDRYHWEPGQSPCRKRPSIHMPRWASRITLEVTSVRVERLQDISEADAIAEGIDQIGGATSCTPWKNYGLKPGAPHAMNCSSPITSYSTLWASINGLGSWDLNPWVWVIEFKCMEGGAA